MGHPQCLLSRNFGGFQVVSEGELDFEGAAFSRFAGDVDLAVVFVDDATNEREPEACTCCAGGVERPEDLGLLLR